MATRSQSIDALVERASKDFEKLRADYNAALNSQTISEDMKIDIKNIFENLRSALDYLAMDVVDELGVADPGKIYFPIRDTENDFISTVRRDFPDLDLKFPGVYDAMKSVQPFLKPWLGKFNRLNNNNKHQNLVEQTRKESRRVSVSRPGSGGGVSWGPGVKFGKGVSVMGVPIDPKTQ